MSFLGLLLALPLLCALGLVLVVFMLIALGLGLSVLLVTSLYLVLQCMGQNLVRYTRRLWSRITAKAERSRAKGIAVDNRYYEKTNAQ